jgi:hypothetical protein
LLHGANGRCAASNDDKTSFLFQVFSPLRSIPTIATLQPVDLFPGQRPRFRRPPSL